MLIVWIATVIPVITHLFAPNSEALHKLMKLSTLVKNGTNEGATFTFGRCPTAMMDTSTFAIEAMIKVQIQRAILIIRREQIATERT